MEHACIIFMTKNGLISTECLVSFMSVSVLLSCRCHLCPKEEVFSLSVLAGLQKTQRHHIPVYRRAVSISVQSAHGTVLPALLNYMLFSCESIYVGHSFLTDNYSKSSALFST